MRLEVVGATGIEPVTPSVSGRCSPAELRARRTGTQCVACAVTKSQAPFNARAEDFER